MRIFKWVGEYNGNYWQYLIINENKIYKNSFDGSHSTIIDNEETMVRNWEYLNKYLEEDKCIEIIDGKEIEKIKINLL